MELPEDDQPDDNIWNHPEKLEAWFETVKERRLNPNKEKVSNEEWDNVEMEQNEYAAQIKKDMGIK